MGFFDKIKNGLKKTKDSMIRRVETVIHSFTKIDEDFFEELEETLILCDIGVQTSVKICDELRSRIKKTGETDPAVIKDMLKEIISEMMSGSDEMHISTKPSIILMIGVNGVGKTTTIGKLAANYKAQGKKVILGAADTFRAAAAEQLGFLLTDLEEIDPEAPVTREEAVAMLYAFLDYTGILTPAGEV